MISIGFTMVKNEEDIIEQFIRHNLKYLDIIYIFDHYSEDSTREIIKKISEEGLNVVLANDIVSMLFKIDKSHNQPFVMNIIFRLLYQHHGPNIYFPLDADEFIFYKNGPLALRNYFLSLDKNSCIRLPWRHLIIDDINHIYNDVPNDIKKIQSTDELNIDGDKIIMVISTPITDIDKIYIKYGNHDIGDGNHEFHFLGCLQGLYYLHVPIRSKEQIIKKSILGWFATILLYGKHNNQINMQWKIIYKNILIDFTVSQKSINDIYTIYIKKEFEKLKLINNESSDSYFFYEMKYKSLRMPFLKTIFESIENFLDEKNDKQNFDKN